MSQSVPAAAGSGSGTSSRSRRPGEGAERVRPPTGVRRTGRWRGVTGLTLLAIGVGLLLEEPAVLLASVFGVAFAAYGQVGSPPTPTLVVERTVAAEEPDAGDEVPVTVTVRNEGEATLPDVRLVDGVPDGLTVADGSARAAAALRPGGEVDLAYEVEVARGRHEFDPLVAVCRDVTGATERVVEVGEPDDIECVPSLPAEPPSFGLRAQTTRYTGRTTADEGGTGVEFHATREYRTGDPLARIDWKRTARTGDLTTVEYRRERSASVLLVVDARREAYVASEAHGRSAVDRSVEAAIAVAASLLADGHLVGLTAVGPRSCWLAPGQGAEHRLRLTRLLASSDAFARRPPSEDVNAFAAGREIRERVADDTQVVVFSPLVDDGAAQIARRFEAHGHLTTVVSPDPCDRETIGQHAASIARSTRITDARHAGLPTIDWATDEPFERALLRSTRRWSA